MQNSRHVIKLPARIRTPVVCVQGKGVITTPQANEPTSVDGEIDKAISKITKITRSYHSTWGVWLHVGSTEWPEYFVFQGGYSFMLVTATVVLIKLSFSHTITKNRFMLLTATVVLTKLKYTHLHLLRFTLLTATVELTNLSCSPTFAYNRFMLLTATIALTKLS